MTRRLSAFLAEHTDRILAAANASMARAHLPHYDHAPIARERLQALLLRVIRCADERHLTPIVEHAERLAAERHRAGVDLAEVQTAINVLEEAIWSTILATMPREEQSEALGVVSTILGAAKDRLACAYVALVTGKPALAPDLRALFQGAGASAGDPS